MQRLNLLFDLVVYFNMNSVIGALGESGAESFLKIFL
jgi:hypothetical protein